MAVNVLGKYLSETLTFAVILVFSEIRISLDSFQAVLSPFPLIEVERISLGANISHTLWYLLSCAFVY